MTYPQPVPPSWKDLGKSSNDLLTKEYPFDGTHLEIKTQTPSNVSFKVQGSRDAKTDVIAGDIEGKWSDKVHGLTLTQTWTTSNILRNQIELDNLIVQGLKFDLKSSLSPDKGTKTANLNTFYKQSGLHSHAMLDVFKGPTFTADTVIGRDGFLVGAEASYNVTAGNISRYAAALAYNANDYSVTLHGLNNFNTFSASYYHRVSSEVEAAAKAVYDTKSNHGGVLLEVGSKTVLDKDSFIKAKINNAGVIGLGYTQTLRKGIKASFALALDTQKLNEPSPAGPAHKVGVKFVFDS
jgi:voltage-dependent anion channel protein 2